MDAQEGGVVEINGNVFEIEPNENRIHGALWANGAMIEILYSPTQIEGLDDSDRLTLRVTDCNKVCRSWNLNVEDALETIEGLTIGVKCCLENNIPYAPVAQRTE